VIVGALRKKLGLDMRSKREGRETRYWTEADDKPHDSDA
jgi:hypothetical protein